MSCEFQCLDFIFPRLSVSIEPTGLIGSFNLRLGEGGGGEAMMKVSWFPNVGRYASTPSPDKLYGWSILGGD